MEGYNLMILGKSGVGKSSLLNYIFNQDLAKTGSGEPVTKQGFHLETGFLNGANVNIYDSWGLEPGKTDIWLNQFENFISAKRKERDIKKWIHTVIFCLSGEGMRMEPFEKKIIEFLKKEKLRPVIVVTKADADKDGIFKKEVYKVTGKQPIEVCSVTKIIGLGKNKKEVKGYGREEIIENILTSSVDSFKDRFKYIKKRLLLERAKTGEHEVMVFVKKEIKRVETLINNISEEDSKAILNKVDSRLKNYDIVTEQIVNKLLIDAEDFYKDKILSSYRNSNVSKQVLAKKFNNPDKKKSLSFWEIILVPFVIVPSLIIDTWTYLSEESKYDFEERVQKIVHDHFEKSSNKNNFELNSN